MIKCYQWETKLAVSNVDMKWLETITKFLPQSFHLFCSRHLDILRGSVCISRSILPKTDDMLLVLHWAACWYFPHIKFTVYSANVSSAEFVTYFPSTIITQWQKNPRCKSSWLGFIWQPIWISVFWIITSIATTKNITQFLEVQCRVFRNRTVYPLPYGTRTFPAISKIDTSLTMIECSTYTKHWMYSGKLKLSPCVYRVNDCKLRTL